MSQSGVPWVEDRLGTVDEDITMFTTVPPPDGREMPECCTLMETIMVDEALGRL